MSKQQNTMIRSLEDSLRANRDDGQEQGIIEGYFALWDQVDSHNTTFQRGCFAKSIKERANKIVIRNSHGNPIGKPLEIREDEKGAYFVGQLSLDVQEAREAYTLVKDEVVSGLSFGFVSVHDKIGQGGIRNFTEVKLLEISPTWLPSGDDSRITNVREMEDDIEQRATNFDDTMLSNTSIALWDSIHETVQDIWWAWVFGESDDADVMVKMDDALNAFHMQYLEFTSQWIQMVNRNNAEDGMRSSPLGDLQVQVRDAVISEKRTADEFISAYGIKKETFESLRRGKHVADLEEAAKLPDNLRTLNNQLRAADFEQLFTELRTHMSNGELRRSDAMLAICGNSKDNSECNHGAELRSNDILEALKKLNGEDANV